MRALVGELEAALAAQYPNPEERHGLDVDALFRPHVRFFVATRDGEALGCGGIALFDGFAEVKRMYVRPAARGSGVADAIMNALESAARAEGLSVLRLETGDRQHAAIRFYLRSGFRPCDVFGAYVSMAPHQLASSVFYEKLL